MQIDNLKDGQERARDIAFVLTQRDNKIFGTIENFKVTETVTSYDEPNESTDLN